MKRGGRSTSLLAMAAGGRNGRPASPTAAQRAVQGDDRHASPGPQPPGQTAPGNALARRWRGLRAWRPFRPRRPVPVGAQFLDAHTSLSLTAQFSIVGSAVLLIGMALQGGWMVSTIEAMAKYHAGTAAALFVDHVIAPYLAQLRPGELLTPEQHETIEALMLRASRQMQIAAMKIWATDGTILYSTHPEAVGHSFDLPEALRNALAGHVSVEFDVLDEDESRWERAIGIPLIEVYVPVRNAAGSVIAVAEFYENATALDQELVASRRHTWIVTGTIFLGMLASLLVIVRRGSRLIEQQRHALTEKISELSDLLHQNTLLRERVEQASRLAAVESEHVLQRLGADLHDGPAQLIGFALLRLDSLEAATGGRTGWAGDASDISSVRSALHDAMAEVRGICAGLSMPRIASLSIAEAIRTVIREHERRTGTLVASHVGSLPEDTPHFVKASLCRLVQEGLSNSFRHAAGKEREVSAWAEDHVISVEVTDNGPGIEPPGQADGYGGLGLVGLANRIENLGGTLLIESVPGQGTRLRAKMSISGRDGSLLP